MGLHRGSVRHYGLDDDVNGLLLMADIVLYGSAQDEQGFPPLLTRAMSFGIPVIAPDYPVIQKYVSLSAILNPGCVLLFLDKDLKPSAFCSFLR